MGSPESLTHLGSHIHFNLALAGELWEKSNELYRRLLLGVSCEGIEKATLEGMAQSTRDAFGIQTQIHGEIAPCGPGERMVWIGNHPPYETQWLTVHAMSQLASHTRGIAKDALLWNPLYLPPLLAWPAALGSMIAFVSRNDHQKAIESVQTACERILRPDSGIVLFTDKHRPTRDRILDDRKKFDRLYPNQRIKEWLTHTCFPSSPGLMHVLTAIPEIRIINFTSGIDHQGIHGGTFHIKMDEVSKEELFSTESLPESRGSSHHVSQEEARLRAWMLRDYEMKNAQLRKWEASQALI